MNEGEFISLSNNVGFVLVDDLPPTGGCNILCLSNREVHIIRRFVYPFAEWRSRFVRWLYGNIYQTATEAEYLEYQDEIGQLFNDIGGEDMGCSELASALQALASAMERGGGSGGVNGGNCSGVGIPGQAAGYLGQYGNTQLLPPPAGSVVENVPPEGFETWGEYLAYKCRAAQQVFAFILGFCRQCQGLKLLVVTATIAGPLLAGWMGVWGAIAITPLGWVAAVSSLVAIATLESLAFWGFESLGDYLELNKSAIICSLYTSGDAVAAREQIASYIEDGIQAIEWSTIGLEALGPAISSLMGSVMAATVENGVVNILFELQADVAYPDAECDCEFGTYEWHFDADAEDWEELYDVQSPNTGVGQWLDTVLGGDGTDSPGRLVTYLARSDGSKNCKGGWIFTVPGTPVATLEEVLQADIWQGASGGVCRYYLRIQYTDSTNDENIQIAQDSQWKQCSIAVSEGNVGKSIKYFYVLFDFNGSDTGACDFGIDNVRTNVPMS